MISSIFVFDTVRVPVFYLSKNRTENRFLVPVRAVNRVPVRVGVDYKSPITITITITVPIKLSITITITVVIEKAITITITITITIIRLRLQLLVYHGNDSRLFIQHVHLQYYHA